MERTDSVRQFGSFAGLLVDEDGFHLACFHIILFLRVVALGHFEFVNDFFGDGVVFSRSAAGS